jgi:hypothetical protein
MATTYKRLGAILSSGVIGTADTVYTCPAATSAVVSTIVICNQAASPATYRLAISTTTSFVTSGYLIYGAIVPANDSIFLTIGATLDSTNKYLLCSGSANTLSFTVLGAENT